MKVVYPVENSIVINSLIKSLCYKNNFIPKFNTSRVRIATAKLINGVACDTLFKKIHEKSNRGYNIFIFWTVLVKIKEK